MPRDTLRLVLFCTLVFCRKDAITYHCAVLLAHSVRLLTGSDAVLQFTSPAVLSEERSKVTCW